MLTKRPMIAAMVGLLMLMAGNIYARGNAERGADLTFDCIECHKMDGKGDYETPPIAGLSYSYLLKKLRNFYGNREKSLDDIMHLYTEDRTDQDLQDLAAYWSSRPK